MVLSAEAIEEVQWWQNHLNEVKKFRKLFHTIHTIHTDASLSGWGGTCAENGWVTSGSWSPNLTDQHINALELWAILFSLEGFTSCHTSLAGASIRLLCDNMTAVKYVNSEGGRIRSLNKITKKIYEILQHNELHISAFYIPSSENVIADFLSRLHENTEWMLHQQVFDEAVKLSGVTPDMDLFATRDNKRLHVFCSWAPDPTAYAIDAFSIPWNTCVYLFPPFNLIQRVLNKIELDGTPCAILVVPLWTSAAWFPSLSSFVSLSPPIVLGQGPRILSFREKKFPLRTRFLWTTLSGQRGHHGSRTVGERRYWTR